MTTLTDPSTGDAGRSHRGRRAVLVVAAVLAVLALVLVGGSFAYAKSYDGKALPGTTVAGQDVSGKTAEEIAPIVAKRAEGTTVTVTAGDQTREATLAELGVTVDAGATASAATAHESDVVAAVLSSLSGSREIAPVVSVDREVASQFATGLVPGDRTAAADAQVTYDKKAESWSVVPGRSGLGIDAAAFADTVAAKAPALEPFSIDQPVAETTPALTDDAAQTTVDAINASLEQPMTVTGPQGKAYEVPAKTRSSWLSVGPNEAHDGFEITADDAAIAEWVQGKATKEATKPTDGVEQVDASGAVVKVVSEKKDGTQVSNADEVTKQLATAAVQGTPVQASFELTPKPAKVTKAKLPTGPLDPAAADPTGEKWIDVDLSAKTVTAYIGETPVWGPVKIVDGKKDYETVTGTYEIYNRLDKQDMTNASKYPQSDSRYYYTEDVPWVQYFHNGYAFHGAPWRDTFGYSGSHGCVNMKVSDAKWLYDWASTGTKVVSHY